MQTVQEYMKGKESITFRQFLKTMNEDLAAYEGDYEGNKSKLSSITKTVIKKYYKELDIFKTGDSSILLDAKCYIIEEETKVILGYFREDKFVVICELHPTKYSDINKFGYKKVLQTSEIATAKDYRGMGYATTLYLTLIENGYTLISDYSQFDGARKLWKKLQNHITLDVYNELADELHRDHTIKNTEMKDLDKEWSKFPDTKAMHILFITHD